MSQPLYIHGRTDPGQERERNEDAFAIEHLPDGTVALVVCDGMGGHERGDVASRLAVDEIVRTMAKRGGDKPVATIFRALRHANVKVSKQSAGVAGMGTTAVIAMIRSDQCTVGWVGDSRLYHFRRGIRNEQTVDHTRVQKMVEAGMISPDQARTHPDAHVLTMALGGGAGAQERFHPAVWADSLALQPGDVLLLCSDGLTDLFTDDELYRQIAGKGYREAVDHLVDEANKRGGHDNITVVIAVAGVPSVPVDELSISADVGPRHTVEGTLDESVDDDASGYERTAEPGAFIEYTSPPRAPLPQPPRGVSPALVGVLLLIAVLLGIFLGRAFAQTPESACAYTARVVSPLDKGLLHSGREVRLRAALFDAANQVPLPGSPSLEFELTVGEDRQVIQADDQLEASWTPPAVGGVERVNVEARGSLDGQMVCPGPVVENKLTAVPIDIDSSGLPAVCYVGVTCLGEIRLVRPQPGAERAAADTFLESSETRTLLRLDGRPIDGPRSGDTVQVEFIPEAPGHPALDFELAGPTGSIAIPPHPIEIRAPLQLRLPGTLDWGTVPAGNDPLEQCQTLDFSKSSGAARQQWTLRIDGLAGCESTPLLRIDEPGGPRLAPLDKPIALSGLDPSNPKLTLCLQTPRCAADASGTRVMLRVDPKDPRFSEQAAKVALRWEVSRRNPVLCHIWKLAGLLALVVAGWAIAGVVRPARFQSGTGIRIAGSAKGLKRTSVQILTQLPGSRPGFHRNARLHIDGQGNVVRSAGASVMTLEADRVDGLRVTRVVGTLERMSRRDRKWSPVEMGAGHRPTSADYRVGELYFRVEL